MVKVVGQSPYTHCVEVVGWCGREHCLSVYCCLSLRKKWNDGSCQVEVGFAVVRARIHLAGRSRLS